MLRGASLLVGDKALCLFRGGEGVSFIFASYWSDAMVGGEGALWSGVDGGEIW